MGLWRNLACLSLLLLILFQLEATKSSAEDHHGKFSSFKVGSVPSTEAARAHKNFRGNADKDSADDEIFGGDKRKVYTGPNPLHNR